MTNITQDDLLNHLYKEDTANQKQDLQQMLMTDSDTTERYEMLRTVKDSLNEIPLMSPDQKTLDKIFNYAEDRSEVLDTLK